MLFLAAASADRSAFLRFSTASVKVFSATFTASIASFSASFDQLSAILASMANFFKSHAASSACFHKASYSALAFYAGTIVLLAIGLSKLIMACSWNLNHSNWFFFNIYVFECELVACHFLFLHENNWQKLVDKILLLLGTKSSYFN